MAKRCRASASPADGGRPVRCLALAPCSRYAPFLALRRVRELNSGRDRRLCQPQPPSDALSPRRRFALPTLAMTLCRFFFNDPATTEIYTLSLHDALPISSSPAAERSGCVTAGTSTTTPRAERLATRSEEHTSELQSPVQLVCRLLLE